MQVTFDEIFAGEINRSMGVLSTTLTDDVSRNLAHHLDLPGQSPNGFRLTSYVQGLVVGDRYVFAKTSADPIAQRGGMVFSHALVIEKSRVAMIVDLGPIFEILMRVRPEAVIAKKRTVALKESTTATPPGHIFDMLGSRQPSVVVLTDSDYFEDIVVRVWNRLLPCMRPRFRFGISFDPQESCQQDLNIALVPRVLLQRWPSDHRAFPTDDPAPVQTEGGQFLLNSQQDRLAEFVDKCQRQFKTDPLIGNIANLKLTHPGRLSIG